MVFATASEVIQTLSGVDINTKQIERICHKYGQWIEEEDLQQQQTKGKRFYSKEESELVHYVVTDASVHDSQALEELLSESDNGNLTRR